MSRRATDTITPIGKSRLVSLKQNLWLRFIPSARKVAVEFYPLHSNPWACKVPGISGPLEQIIMQQTRTLLTARPQQKLGPFKSAQPKGTPQASQKNSKCRLKGIPTGCLLFLADWNKMNARTWNDFSKSCQVQPKRIWTQNDASLLSTLFPHLSAALLEALPWRGPSCRTPGDEGNHIYIAYIYIYEYIYIYLFIYWFIYLSWQKGRVTSMCWL